MTTSQGAPITSIEQLDMNATYTVADYLSWQMEEMVELIRGRIWRMSPAPIDPHAAISVGILSQLTQQIPLKAGCKVRFAPYDVYLSGLGAERPDIVQPDIVIICDPGMIKRRGCMGAPTWVCEILSPATAKKDVGLKKERYAAAGVPEYCIVSPGDEVVYQYVLEAGASAYGEPVIFDRMSETMPLVSVAGVVLTLAEVFPETVED